MDDLKEGIHLRAYGQKDPIVEYKTEAFSMFMELIDMINNETLNLVFKLFPTEQQEVPMRRQPRAPRHQEMTLTHSAADGMGLTAPEPVAAAAEGGEQQAEGGGQQRPVTKQQPVRVGDKVGCNDFCLCGSGKKYKSCHGK